MKAADLPRAEARQVASTGSRSPLSSGVERMTDALRLGHGDHVAVQRGKKGVEALQDLGREGHLRRELLVLEHAALERSSPP
ncbi:MAG: hypothetical protein U1G05_05510 [Kiritimatiellia bacterium]